MAATLGTLTLDLVARISEFNRNMESASRTVQRASTQMNDAITSTGNALKYLLAMSGTYLSLTGLIDAADKYTEISNRIKLVTASQAEFTNAMEATFRVAQDTRQSWEQTTMVYQRFMQVSAEMGISQARIASVVETVNKAVAISGSSAQSAEAAMMQFGQAIGSGVLRGEEFNSVAEQAPGLLQAIAKGLNVTTAELRTMANNGKLTGGVLVKALEAAKESTDTLFAATNATLGQAFTNFSNQLKKFVGELGQSTGFMQSFGQAVIFVGKHLELLGNLVGSIAIYKLTKMTIDGSQALVQYVKEVKARRIADAEAAAQAQSTIIMEARRAAAITIAAEHEALRAAAALEAARTDVVAKQTMVQAETALTTVRLANIKTQIDAEKARIAAGNLSAEAEARAKAKIAALQKAEVTVKNELKVHTQALTAAENALTAALERQGAAQAALVTARTNQVVADRAATASSLRLGGALAFVKSLLSPMSIAITAATAAMFYFTTQTSDATKELEFQGKSVRELTEDYNKLSTAKLLSEMGKLATETDTLNAKIEEATKALKKGSGIGFFESLAGSGRANLAKITASVDGFLEVGSKAHLSVAMLQEDLQFKKIDNATIGRITNLAQAVVDLNNDLNRVKTASELANAQIGDMSNSMDANKALLDTYEKSLRVTVTSLEEMSPAFDDMQQALERYATQASLDVIQQNLLNKATKDYKAETITATDYLQTYLKVLGTNTKMTEETKNRYVELAKTHDNAKKVADDLRKKISDLTAEMGINTKTIEDNNAANIERNKLLGEQKEKLDKLNKSAKIDLLVAQAELDAKIAGQDEIGVALAGKKAKLAAENAESAADNTEQHRQQVELLEKQAELSRQSKAYDEAQQKQKQAADEAERKRKQAADEAERKRQQASDRAIRNGHDIRMQYATSEAQLRMKFNAEIAKLEASNLGAEKEKFRAAIVGKFEAERLEMVKNHNLRVNEYRITEEERIKYAYEADEKIIKARSDLSDGQRKDELGHLKDQYNYDIAQMYIAEKERKLAANEYHMTELERIDARYKIELDKIALLKGVNNTDRQEAAAAKVAEQIHLLGEKAKEAKQAVTELGEAYNAILNPQQAAKYDLYKSQKEEIIRLEQEHARQLEAIRLAEQTDGISRLDEIAEAEQLYRDTKLAQELALAKQLSDLKAKQRQEDLDMVASQLSTAQGMWSSMTDMMKEAYGEQSSTYKAMFAVQKAVAIAQATISAFGAYNNALLNVPAPANIPVANMILGLGMAQVGMMTAMAINGFSKGGYTGNTGRSNVAGVVHGQEYVLNADATKRIGVDNLNRLNSGQSLGNGGNVAITVNVSDSGVKSSGDGEQQLLGQAIGNAVRAVIMQEKRQGGLLSR